MHKLLRFFYASLVLAGILFSCVEDTDPDFETEKFISIFDHTEFSAAFQAIDLAQTEDGGYIVLANRSINIEDQGIGSTNQGIYLLKADKYGNFVSHLEVEDAYINALPQLTEIESNYYFFCTSPDQSYSAQLATVDADLQSISFTPVNLMYPAASSYLGNTSNEFLVLSYNPADKESVVSKVNLSGSITSSESYSIGVGNDIVDEKISNHFARKGRIYPFQVGEVSSGLYFFNGFYDYAFSLVFVNLSSDAPVARIQTEFDHVGFNTIVPLGGTSFATSQFNLGDNFLLPKTSIPLSGMVNPVTFDNAYKIPEFASYAHVKILRTQLDEKNVLIYGSDTKSKQIGLLFYDETTGELLGNRYLGFSNPFDLGNVIKTADGGLAVCGTTYIAGRFPRISISKLSKEEVEKIVR